MPESHPCHPEQEGFVRLPSFEEILASIPRESDEEKANRQRRDREEAALREARMQADDDDSVAFWANQYPTFEGHLENARKRRGLT
jgi:sirohydrochlorin ferrochelatase